MSTRRRAAHKRVARLKSLPEVTRWLVKAGRGFIPQIIFNVVVGLSYVASGLLIVWGTKLCVDIATGAPHPGWTLRGACVFLALIMLFDVSLIFISRWVRAILDVRSRNRLQERIYRHLLSADWQIIHRQHSGQLINRLTQDVGEVSGFLSEKLPSLITALAQFIGAFFFLYWMDNRLAIVVVVVIPVMFILAHVYARRMREYAHDVREQDSDIQAFLQESVQHSLVLKTLEKIDYAHNILVDKHEELHRLIRRNTKYSASAALIVNLSFTIGYLIAFFWGVYSMSRGLITFGAMLAFVQLVNQIQSPVRTLVGYVGVFISTFTACERLIEVEAYPEEVDSDSDDSLHTPMTIQVSDLSFGYEDGKTVFEHLNATFPAGSVTALVGKTGSGKTTLISILLGLLKPTSGSACLVAEGHTPQPLGRSTRRYFSYVPQGNTLFSGTIRQNLQYGCPDATEEEMWHALELAQASFVHDKPKGLDTSCSERGGGLSEGQAQRICIARALLRKTPILLLDEAFSSLDSDTARMALEQILASNPHRTVIYITHRETLVPLADSSIVI